MIPSFGKRIDLQFFQYRYTICLPVDEYNREKTLSFVGEKLMPEVGAECCFSQETF